MNRRIFIQVAAPAVVIGLILFGTCLISAWYIDRLQTNLAGILSKNVASLEAAQELEIEVRRLRFHSFLYLADPTPERLAPIDDDHRLVEEALEHARQSVNTPQERECVQTIEAGYRRYQDEMARLRAEAGPGKPPGNVGELADAHPVRYVVEPCQELLRLNKAKMEETARETEKASRHVNAAIIFLGLAGPLSGLIIGYGVARGLTRSIYRLSVRVQDMAHRLDQDVASISVAADGDIEHLDQQLQHVVHHVEEVAERLQRHQREMLRAEQLSAVGQLAASVAHEVRNPLTAVKMLVEVALRPNNPKPLTREDLGVIHGEVTRLEETVQHFLDFARLPTPQRNPCDLREVVAQAVELVQARARQQGVAIAWSAPENPVLAGVDRTQLHTVIVNLFMNALDVMPSGGKLEVSLEASPAGVRLAIADTGPGIPPEMAGRLFIPFASSKATGTGLGLSISRRIIEEHGGRLTGGNRAEGGACFTIMLGNNCHAEIACDR